jgi:hypothetical protein
MWISNLLNINYKVQNYTKMQTKRDIEQKIRKLKIEQHESHLQLGVNSCAPDKFADPHPHTPIESLLL